MTEGWLHVVRPGLLTTVQDIGRWGHQAAGVPVAGPMDSFSHRLANLLLGNPHRAATLEITLIGPELTVEAETRMVFTGADFDVVVDGVAVAVGVPFAVRPGSAVVFGRRRSGARAYLAVAGGLQTPLVLGSRATHLVSGMGGVGGRALVTGDRLPVPSGIEPAATVRRGVGLLFSSSGRARLRVLPGPQDDWFTPEAWSTLCSKDYRVTPRSNRMGFKLDGPPIAHARGEEPISEPTAVGAIQVPAAGEPVLLMADRQTAGGYPKIATVIAADLPLAGQLAPGDAISFEACTWREAAAALIARERQLLRYTDLREVP